MNKHVSMKKKVLSFFLAFVILFSSMPAELFTFAFANENETEPTTQPAVSVKLSATQEKVAAGDSTAFTIAVNLTEITSADVKITLTEDEQALFDDDVMQALKKQNDSFKLTAKAGATDEYELSFTATGTKDYTVTLNSPFEAPASDEENDAQKDTTAEEKSSADENAAEKELTLDIVDGDIAVVSYEVAEPETPADDEQNGEDPSDQENPSDTEGENDPAGSQDPGVSTTPTENENPVTEEQEPSQEQTAPDNTVTETPTTPTEPSTESTPTEEPAAPVDTTENTPTPLFAEAALAATTTSDDQGVKIVTEGVTITFQAPVVEENPSENPGEGEEDEDQKPDEGSEDKDPSVNDDKDENKKPEETDPDAGANGDENNGNIDRAEIAASALDYSVSISGDEQNLTPVDRKLPAFSVTATASLKDASTIAQPGTFTFNLQLQLPAGTTLPSGSLSASDFTISTKILKLFKTSTIADAAFSDENATIGEVSYDETTSILTIPITQTVDVTEVTPEPQEPTDNDNNSEGSVENGGTAGDGSVDNNDENSGENNTTPTARTTETTYEPTATSWTYTLNFAKGVFEVPATFAGGTISASIVDAEGSTLSGGDSLTIGAEVIEPSEEISVAEKGRVSQTILWMDNNNEGNTRPDTDDERLTNLGLYFRTDGGSWELLDIDKLGDLGLTSLPTISVTKEADSYTLASSAELPTKLNKLDANGEPFDEPITVEWSIGEPNKEGESVPPEIDGYQASIDGDTWVYVQLAEMTFDILLRWGDLGESQSLADIEEDLRQYFALYSDVEGSDPITLDALYNEGKLTFDTENNTFTITGMPRFDATNNHPINYTINPATEVTGDMVIDVPGLEAGDPAQGIDGDKLTATYNNADAGNHGTDVDALYPGGQLILTLPGETTFVAYKEWLDLADTSGRPDLSFQLWRYEEGESYKTAAQVRGEDNQFIIIDLPETDADGERYDPQTPIPITLDENDKILEKYSPEGNRYHYFVREVVEDTEGANKYEQIYGKVTRASDTAEEVVEDTVPYGETRENGDTGIYYKGTISNRLTDTKTATLEKKWNAAAYQGYLTDVRAEFALEVLYPDVDGKFPENPSDEDWLAYPSEEEQITAVQSPITEESMVSWSVTKQVPTYGPLGREARYRWVETGVYQGTNSTDDLLQDGTFTLEHNGHSVTYTSTSETTYENQENSTGNSNTVITNDIAGTLDYHVMKIWKGVGTENDGETYQPYELTFDLYRQISGSALTEDEEPYLSFTWDGEEIALENDAALPEDITEVELDNFFDDVIIDDSKKDDGIITWHTVLNELPRFDNEGREYEYLLLERDHQPDYNTWRDDDGNYYTDVTNAPGQGNRILIRKEWNDDSDSAHRGSVTIQVYKRSGNFPVGDPVPLEKGVWTETVGIGTLEPTDVYILETGVTVDGKKYQVPLQSYIFGQEDGPKYDNPTAPTMAGESGDYDRYQYDTEHHRYEATYSESELSGEKLYIVNNRRLGNIDLTVTKKWDDGDGLMRNALKEANEALAKGGNDTVAPKLKLVFADGFTGCGTIDESTVTLIDGAPTQIQDANGITVSSTQVIDLDEATSTIYFYNLPKYEQDGRVVRYSVKEIWTTQQDGKELTKAALKGYLQKNLDEYDGLNDLLKLIDEWSWSVTDDSYDPNYHPETADETPASGESATENEDDGTIPPSSNDALINNDNQTLEITNSLSNTKDVIWHKHWNDQYTYTQNQRPDLYLDIYRVVHTSADPNATAVEVVYDNYHWTADKIEQQASENEDGEDQPVTEVVDQYNWTVTLPDAQKYDAYGYEIFYYAVERTLVDYDSFDYTVGEYVYNGEELGNRNELRDKENALSQDLVISKDEMKSAEGSPAGTDEYPQFALREEGTFVNGLGDTVTIQGQKIWKSTPTGYPAENLPPVTFEVYQMLNGEQVSADPIATYQMNKWSSPDHSGTYLFTIDQTGENNPDAVATQEDSEAATTEKLPRYTEDGQLYQYELRENMNAQLGDEENNVTLDTVFDFDDDESNSYLATNVYNPPKGNIYVKKHLQLPEDMTENDTFPSIQFTLSRTYTGNNGKPVEEKLDNIVTWTSAQVKAAWKAANSETGGKNIVSSDAANLVFEDLPIYAPNGSKYIYTVTERIDAFLYGYTTVAGQGNLEVDSEGYSEESTISVGELEPVTVDQPATDGSEAQNESDTQPAGIPSTAYATFKNTYAQKAITLEGTKEWEDYGDAFGMRPDELTITVTRSAASQPGQNNAIANDQTFTEGSYTVKWDKPENSNTWKYTINGADGNELDAYAPNGMPWTYKVTETLTGEQAEFYRQAPGSVSVNVDTDTGENKTDNTLTFAALKNSMTAGVTFEKKWQDKAGNAITDDYLGRELSVTFKAQVREEGSSKWQDAAGYFVESMETDDYQTVFPDNEDESSYFEKTLTGKLTETNNWKGRFDNLPGFIKKDGNFVRLEYRVVETGVKNIDSTQSISIENSQDDYNEITSGQFVIDADLAVSGTNSTTTNKLDLGSLTITKNWENDNANKFDTRPGVESDTFTWQANFIIQRETAQDQWETLKAPNGKDDKVFTIRGADGDSGGSISVTGLPEDTYRVIELQPEFERGADGTIDTKYFVGIVSDDNSFYNGMYTAQYNSGEMDSDKNTTMAFIVTNTLNTRTNISVEKVWRPDAPDGASIDAVLQYSNDGEIWSNLETVTLNSTTGWTHTWTNLPAKYPANASADTTTKYRVAERNAQGGFILLSNEASEDGTKFTITNVATTSLNVTKVWKGFGDNLPEKITVQLYRTMKGDSEETKLDDKTLTLTAENGWQGSFTNLEAYDAAGNEYTYFAREVETGDYDVHYQDATTDNAFTTVITNVAQTDVTGTKTWKDNSNKYNTRPSADKMVLTLYRSVNDGEPKEVENVKPEWSNTDSDQWTYTYKDLPKTDVNGNVYTYTVKETLPEGYELSKQDGFNLTNTLTGTVEVSGTKTWIGGQPEDLELTLSRSTDGENWTPVEVADGQPTWENTNTDKWSYTYSDLPKYDENGVLYRYKVAETVPQDYDSAAASGEAVAVKGGDENVYTYNFTNVKKGALTVEKIVQGNRGETDRAFEFTVKLTGKSQTGFEANTINGKFGDMTFKNGVATFTLKHGESITANGLPAGLTYTVEETNANADGYTTSNSGNTGTIPTGDTEKVYFTNTRHEGEALTTSVSVQKVWKIDNGGEQPESVKVQLEKDGQPYGNPVTLSDKNGWQHEWKDLPLGFTWTVEEVGAPDGFTSYINYYNNHFVITNDDVDTEQKPETVNVKKVWVIDDGGERPDSVSVQLMRDGDPFGDPVTLNDDNDWSHAWNNLESGHNWTVVELNVPDGFKATVSQSGDTFTIVNDDTTEETTEIRANKEWTIDDGGTRADSVTVQLYCDGQPWGNPVTLSDSNDWTTLWEELPVGHSWSVVEINVPAGFTSSVTEADGVITITNDDIPVDIPDPERPDPDPEDPDPDDDPTDIPDQEKPDPDPDDPEPEDPDDPTDIPDSEKPDTDDPDDPTDIPDAEKPDDNKDPDNPTTPSNPSTPSSPSTPSHSTTPGTSGTTTTTTTDKSDDKDAPQTGDNTHTRALFALCLASLAGMTVIGVSRKRQRKNDSDQS